MEFKKKREKKSKKRHTREAYLPAKKSWRAEWLILQAVSAFESDETLLFTENHKKSEFNGIYVLIKKDAMKISKRK